MTQTAEKYRKMKKTKPLKNQIEYTKPQRTIVFKGQVWPRHPIVVPPVDEELERRRKKWQKN